MASSIFSGQPRTRSQLVLPDSGKHLPYGSPLKQARKAARRDSSTTTETCTSTMVNGTERRTETQQPEAEQPDSDSDDELLLSPKKPFKDDSRPVNSTKRSLRTFDDSLTLERQSKRVKLGETTRTDNKNRHARHCSVPLIDFSPALLHRNRKRQKPFIQSKPSTPRAKSVPLASQQPPTINFLESPQRRTASFDFSTKLTLSQFKPVSSTSSHPAVATATTVAEVPAPPPLQADSSMRDIDLDLVQVAALQPGKLTPPPDPPASSLSPQNILEEDPTRAPTPMSPLTPLCSSPDISGEQYEDFQVALRDEDDMLDEPNVRVPMQDNIPSPAPLKRTMKSSSSLSRLPRLATAPSTSTTAAPIPQVAEPPKPKDALAEILSTSQTDVVKPKPTKAKPKAAAASTTTAKGKGKAKAQNNPKQPKLEQYWSGSSSKAEPAATTESSPIVAPGVGKSKLKTKMRGREAKVIALLGGYSSPVHTKPTGGALSPLASKGKKKQREIPQEQEPEPEQDDVDVELPPDAVIESASGDVKMNVDEDTGSVATEIVVSRAHSPMLVAPAEPERMPSPTSLAIPVVEDEHVLSPMSSLPPSPPPTNNVIETDDDADMTVAPPPPPPAQSSLPTAKSTSKLKPPKASLAKVKAPANTTTTKAVPKPRAKPVSKAAAKPSVARTRVTRSGSLLKQKDRTVHDDPQIADAAPIPSELPKESTVASSSSFSGTVPTNDVFSNGSPMRISTPPRAAPLKKPKGATAEKSNGSNLLLGATALAATKSAPSSPSPSKIARSSSSFIRPSYAAGGRSQTGPSSTFSNSFSTFSGPAFLRDQPSKDSLTSLSDALEKLREPAPSRPNTSMGFNRDLFNDDDGDDDDEDDEDKGKGKTGGRDKGKQRAQDDVGVGKASDGNSNSKVSSTTKRVIPPFKPRAAGQQTLPFSGGATNGPRPRMFVMGRAPQVKASRKPALPSVMGSPVKGGAVATASTSTVDGDVPMSVDSTSSSTTTSAPSSSATTTTTNTIVAPPPAYVPTGNAQDDDLAALLARAYADPKPKAPTKWKDSSWRVTKAFEGLSQSLNALPARADAGLMGPPEMPVDRTTADGSPSSSSSSTPVVEGDVVVKPSLRMSSRIASSTSSRNNARGGNGGGDASSSSTDPKGKSKAANGGEQPQTLGVLKDCVMFVDVKTDTGEDSGGVFMDMLVKMGAKLLTRVGQTCTHIVYKNGMASTLSRYKLLREPLPLVVGIAWVVECAEKRARVDEDAFLVDLEEAAAASGGHKRRKSMLPKMMAFEDYSSDVSASLDNSSVGGADGDRSMDGSTSSLIDDYNELTPLERARQRRIVSAS